MTDDKWEHLRITRPRLWERREQLKESFRKSMEDLRVAREGDGEIPMRERVEIAREMLGELAQEVEAHEDGSVTVHLPNFH